jgi:hypothetical protein
MSGKIEDVPRGPWTNHWTGGREAGNQVVHRFLEDEWLDIVEDLATTQTGKETTSGSCDSIGAEATTGYSLPINGWNGDMLIEMWHVCRQPELWSRQTAVTR